MPSDVCEGCRRLRKKCPKEECVLLFSLEYLYPGNKIAQGNVTNHLAKSYGRKKFLHLLDQQPQAKRPELFNSLLREAVGRDINPVTGIAGLIERGDERVVDDYIEKVKGGFFLTPSHSSDASASAPAHSCRESSVAQSGSRPILLLKPKRERYVEEDPTTPEECIEDEPPRKKARFDLNEEPKVEEYEIHAQT